MRSLLDAVDLSVLRPLFAAGPTAAVAAAVVDGGVLQAAPDDPLWRDRDRLVVAGDSVRNAVVARLRAGGLEAPHDPETRRRGGAALALAFGLAGAAVRDGAVWRALCLLDERACGDGEIWEVARTAADPRDADAGATLKAVVGGGATAALWAACGWTVHAAPHDDPARVLAAFDHALAEADRPAVVLAT